MARYNNHKNSFSTGKLGKRFQGRLDTKDYGNGLEELLNAIPLRQGGVSKRPGTQFLSEIDVTSEAQIIPFIESKEVFSLIVIDPGQASIFDHVRIYESVNFQLNQLSNGAEIFYSIEYQGDAGLKSGLAGKYHYAQTASFLFITHSSGKQKPFIIFRDSGNYNIWWYTSNTPETLGTNAFVRTDAMSVPYLKSNITSITISPFNTGPFGTSGNIIASSPIFTANHVGSFWRLQYGTDEAIYRVTAFNSATSVTAIIVVAAVAAISSATTDWQESAWSEERGYPSTVTLFEQRLVWGGTPFNADTVEASHTANPFHMMEDRMAQDSVSNVSGINYFGPTGVLDPWSYILSSTQVNKIVWLNSADALQIGTLGGEYIASGGDQILSNESVSIRKQTSYGGEAVQPIIIDNNTFFVTRDGKRMRNFRFNRDNGSFISINMNALNEEIVNENIQTTDNFYNVKFDEMSYQQFRDVVWMTTSRGELVGMSFDQDAGMLAWHSHKISGTDVKIKSITSLPSANFNHDDMYMLVERTVDGNTKTYIERISQDFDHTTMTPPAAGPFPSIDVYDNPWYLDSAVIREVVPGAGILGTVISALSHLEGESVRVLGDGVDLGVFTVTGGQIDIEKTITRAIVGMQYKVKLIPVPVEAGNGRESAGGLTTRIDRTTLRVYKTREIDLYNLREGEKQKIAFDLSDGELFTGEVKGLTPNNIDDRGQFIIQQENAYPLTILSLTYRGVSYDR